MDTHVTPALPSAHEAAQAQERVAEPVVMSGMLLLMLFAWMAAYLAVMPLWSGKGVPMSFAKVLPAPAPLNVTSRLPQLALLGDKNATQSADAKAGSWDDTRVTAEYVAGALVEDQVQSVLLKLHLLGEAGKYVGRRLE